MKRSKSSDFLWVPEHLYLWFIVDSSDALIYNLHKTTTERHVPSRHQDFIVKNQRRNDFELRLKVSRLFCSKFKLFQFYTETKSTCSSSEIKRHERDADSKQRKACWVTSGGTDNIFPETFRKQTEPTNIIGRVKIQNQ